MTIRTTRKQKQALWQDIINQFKASGLKQKEFCKKNRVKFPSLQYWLRKTGVSPEKTIIETPFVEVHTVHPESNIVTQHSDICEITLPSGIRLSFNSAIDVLRLGQIINALREIQC